MRGTQQYMCDALDLTVKVTALRGAVHNLVQIAGLAGCKAALGEAVAARPAAAQRLERLLTVRRAVHCPLN